MDVVDFVYLVSSIELNTIESKKMHPQKPNRYKKSQKREVAATKNMLHSNI